MFRIKFDVLTKEGFCSRGHVEEFEDKDEANRRFKELKDISWAVNVTPETVDVPSRRVVQVRFAPKGTVYTFEVDFKVKKGEALKVLDAAGKEVYVAAVTADYNETEESLSKKFEISKLRKITGKAA